MDNKPYKLNIRQVRQTGRAFSEDIRGKWYCSASVLGKDGEDVYRYLHQNGTWQQHSDYFNTKEALEAVLATSKAPDFTVDWREAYSRQALREDVLALAGGEESKSEEIPDDHPTDDGYEIGPYQIM